MVRFHDIKLKDNIILPIEKQFQFSKFKQFGYLNFCGFFVVFFIENFGK